MPVVPEAGSDATPKKAKVGKNIGWSPKELSALCEVTPPILEDAAVGSGQTAAKMGLHIRARFLDHAPPQSGTEAGTGGELDSRRWEARTGRACNSKWNEVKAACTIYEQAVDFVTAARVTGNPTRDQLRRCHLACFNAHQTGAGMSSRTKHLTVIAMDQHYPVGDPFEYFHCWEYLSENTTLLKADAEIVGPVEEVGAAESGVPVRAAATPVGAEVAAGTAGTAPKRTERPQGVKAAKHEKTNKRKIEGSEDEGGKQAKAVLARMENIAAALDKESERKHLRHKDYRRVHADKLTLSAFNALYAGVALGVPERIAALNEL